MYDLIIIGSGPAGLAAAIYAARAGLHFVVVEQNGVSGGQVLTTYEVENYPALPGISGYELGTKMRRHADSMGASFMEGSVLRIDVKDNCREVICDDKTLQTKTIVIATGATHSKLMVPGEEELSGMGVSYCATCDGAFFKNRDVAVVGGGDVALEDAVFLARICRKVYLIHRRDQFRGARRLREKLEEFDNITLLMNSRVIRIFGEDAVEGAEVLNVTNDEITTIGISGIFIAVGIHPNTDCFADTVKCNQNGYILAGEDCKTSVTGIYAAGDVRNKLLRQIVTAVADGANAVTSVQEYLNESI